MADVHDAAICQLKCQFGEGDLSNPSEVSGKEGIYYSQKNCLANTIRTYNNCKPLLLIKFHCMAEQAEEPEYLNTPESR